MEHLCHRCQNPVEDSVPFCPKCGAPQIRVAVEEGNEPVTQPMPPGTPDDLQPPATPVYPQGESWNHPLAAPDPRRVQWRSALPLAVAVGLLGGALTMVLGRYPFFFLLSMMAVGAFMVRLYRRRARVEVSPGMGAKLGAFGGLFSFLIDAAIIVAMFTLDHGMVQENMRKALEMSGSKTDPETMKLMQGMVDRLNTPEGLALFCVVLLVFFFGFTMFFSAVGGMIGAALYGKDRRPS